MAPVGNSVVTLPTSPFGALCNEVLGCAHGVQGYQEACNAWQHAKKALKSRNHMFYDHTPGPLWEANLVIFAFLAPNNHIYGAQKKLTPSWHHGCWHRSMECCARGTQ